MGFNTGFGALVWIFAAERFPDDLRGAGASAMLLTNLTANLFIARFFLDLLTSAVGVTTYALLFAITVLALLFVCALAPEQVSPPPFRTTTAAENPACRSGAAAGSLLGAVGQARA
ncbi:MFS transporter [Streptomyces sp. NPDC044571]|uniref:MFS transporter n=1 Tax=Streptomyces sp. NPDC044571 TaxID=3155371 RepID=UPI0033FE3FFC